MTTGVGSRRVEAYAGLMPGSDVGAPITGTATYAATYEVLEITDITVFAPWVRGLSTQRSGNIDLTADFDSGNVTGANGYALVVDGDFDGNQLSGNVTYYGNPGNLTGIVGESGIVAAFHGASDDIVFAGGIVGD